MILFIPTQTCICFEFNAREEWKEGKAQGSVIATHGANHTIVYTQEKAMGI